MATIKQRKVADMILKSEYDAIANIEDENADSHIPDEFLQYRELVNAIPGLNAKQKRFLAVFAVCGVQSRAASLARISTSTHFRWLATPEYKDAYAEAVRISNDHLENLAWELASGQRTRPVVSMGKVVTQEQIYDTRLLQALLKARMPDKFATKVDVTSNGHSLVKIVDAETWNAV